MGRSIDARNIFWINVFTVVAFSGRSIWQQSILSNYVYLVADNNASIVGFLTGILGLSQVLSSVPTGVLGDILPKHYLLRVSAVITLGAIAVNVYAVHNGSLQALAVAMTLWGISWGIAYTTTEALFASSVAGGQRSKFMTRKQTLLQLSTCLGPIVAGGMFVYLGNTWTTEDCAIVLIVGNLVCLPLCFILFRMREEKKKEDEKGEEVQEVGNFLNEESFETKSEDEKSRRVVLTMSNRKIALAIALSDLLSGLASGMSIRYFPVFFLDDVMLSPLVVQILYLLSSLGCVVCSVTNQRLSHKYGRSETTIASKWVGISFMILMIQSQTWWNSPKWVISTLYVLRTSFMNSSKALTKSQLMDVVDPKHRAKWSILESVNAFSWSGSAAIGGLLVESYSLIFNFYVTATMQFVATLPLFLLWGLPSEERQSVFESEGDLGAPLLGEDDKDDNRGRDDRGRDDDKMP